MKNYKIRTLSTTYKLLSAKSKVEEGLRALMEERQKLNTAVIYDRIDDLYKYETKLEDLFAETLNDMTPAGGSND